MPNAIAEVGPLLEKKGRLDHQIKDLCQRHQGDDWTDEVQQTFDRLMAEFRSNQKLLDSYADDRNDSGAEERARRIQDLTGKSPEEQRAEYLEWLGAFREYALRGSEMSPEARTVLQRIEKEQRDQNIGTPGDGGYLTHDEFNRGIIEARKNFDVMRRAPTTKITTTTGQPMLWPTVDDTVAGEIIGEASAHDATTAKDIAFGQKSISTFKYSSGIVLVSVELLQDSLITDLPGLIQRLLGQRLANIQQTHFTTGGGTTVPDGIVPQAAVGTQSANDNSIGKDDLIDLFHSIPSQYRMMPSVGWMMNDSFMGAIRKLDNSTNNLMWEANLKLGEPDRLLGKPVYENPAMLDVASLDAADEAWAVFGDLSAYHIRDVRGIQVQRLNELYAANGQVGFMAWVRSGGNLMVAESSVTSVKKVTRAT